MKELAKCQTVQLLKKGKKFFIAEVVEDDHKLHELNKNDAFLIFKDYLAQVVYEVKKPKLNLQLKGK